MSTTRKTVAVTDRVGSRLRAAGGYSVRMLRALLIVATCSMLVGGVALVAPAAEASTRADVTLLLKRLPDHTEDGWSISGAYIDNGQWDTDFRAAGGGPASPTFEVEVKVTLHGSAGDIYMGFQGHFNNVRSSGFGGTWTITGGSGAYRLLEGNGTWTVVDLPDGSLNFTCVGTVRTA